MKEEDSFLEEKQNNVNDENQSRNSSFTEIDENGFDEADAINGRNYTVVDDNYFEDNKDQKIEAFMVNYNAINLEDANKPVNPDGIIPVNNDFMMAPLAHLNNISDNLGEYKERVEELFNRAGAIYALANKGTKDKKPVIIYLPNRDKFSRCTVDPDFIKQWAELYADFDALMDELTEKYPKNTPTGDLLDIILRDKQIMTNPKFNEYQALDPTYEPFVRSNFNTIPVNSFKTDKVDDKGNAIYEADDKKYKELSEKFPFIEMAQERVGFMQNRMIQHEAMRQSNTFTPKAYLEFVDAYKKHLLKQADYVNKIKKISPDDELIKDNYVFAENSNNGVKHGFVMNWQGERYGDPVKNQVRAQFDILDRGWPVDDVPLIQGLDGVIKGLDNIIESELNNDITAQVQNQAKKLKAELVNPIRLAKYSYIASPEVRDDILKGLKEPIGKYVEFMKPFLNGVEDSIAKIYDAAVNRGAKSFEIGSNPVTIMKDADGDELIGAFEYDDITANIDYMVNDLKAVELSYKGSNEFKAMKEALLDLKKYSDRMMTQGVADEENLSYNQKHLNRLKDLRTEIEKTLNATDAYLDHKKRDFIKDETRRDSAKKQKREQPRIRMSLKMRDKLLMMVDRINDYDMHINPKMKGIYDVENSVEAAKDRAWNKISDINKKYEDDKDMKMTSGEYRKNLLKMIYHYQETTSYNFKVNKNETNEEYAERISKVGTKELTNEDLKKEFNNASLIREAVEKEVKKYEEYKNDRSKEHYARIGMDKIGDFYKNVVKDAVKNMGDVSYKDINPTAKRHAKTSAYKNSLVSKPKAPENKGLKK